jgi:hypothetical protein
LTVDRNGKLIDGVAANKTHAVKGSGLKYIFRNNTYGWLVKAFIFMLFALNIHAGDFTYEMNSWEQDSGLSIGTDKLKPRSSGALLSIADSAGTTVATITTSAMTITTATITGLTATVGSISTLDSSTSQIGTLSLTNALSVANGGTGRSSVPAGQILYGNDSGALESGSGFTYDSSKFKYNKTEVYEHSFPISYSQGSAEIMRLSAVSPSYYTGVLKIDLFARRLSSDVESGASMIVDVSKFSNGNIKAVLRSYSGAAGHVKLCEPEIRDGNLYISVFNTSSYYTPQEAYVRVELVIFRIEGGTISLDFLDGTTDSGRTPLSYNYCQNRLGINKLNPERKLEVKDDSGAQLRLTDSTGNYTDFQTDSGGNLSIAPSGAAIKLDKWRTTNYSKRQLSVTSGTAYLAFTIPAGVYHLSITSEGSYVNYALYAIAMSSIRKSQALIVSANDSSLSYTVEINQNGSLYDIKITASVNLDAMNVLAIRMTS